MQGSRLYCGVTVMRLGPLGGERWMDAREVFSTDVRIGSNLIGGFPTLFKLHMKLSLSIAHGLRTANLHLNGRQTRTAKDASQDVGCYKSRFRTIQVKSSDVIRLASTPAPPDISGIYDIHRVSADRKLQSHASPRLKEETLNLELKYILAMIWNLRRPK
jgi:hypothetical protein